MPSESERWKTGDLRNTVGHTEGATGPVTGGVEGHVKSEPRESVDKLEEKAETATARKPFDPSIFSGGG